MRNWPAICGHNYNIVSRWDLNICILLVMNARRIKCVNEGGTRERERIFSPQTVKAVITHTFRGYGFSVL